MDTIFNSITEIEIFPIKPRDGLVGFASFVLDNKLYLGSIGIYTKLDGSGYRLTFPTKPIGGKSLQIYHPITKDLSETIENAIISKFSLLIEKSREDFR